MVRGLPFGPMGERSIRLTILSELSELGTQVRCVRWIYKSLKPPKRSHDGRSAYYDFFEFFHSPFHLTADYLGFYRRLVFTNSSPMCLILRNRKPRESPPLSRPDPWNRLLDSRQRAPQCTRDRSTVHGVQHLDIRFSMAARTLARHACTGGFNTG